MAVGRIFSCLMVSCFICFSFAVPQDMRAEDVLEFLSSQADTGLRTLDFNVRQAADTIQKNGTTSLASRNAIQKLYASTSFLTDCSILNSKGAMLVVEPLMARKLEGTDLSGKGR